MKYNFPVATQWDGSDIVVIYVSEQDPVASPNLPQSSSQLGLGTTHRTGSLTSIGSIASYGPLPWTVDEIRRAGLGVLAAKPGPSCDRDETVPSLVIAFAFAVVC